MKTINATLLAQIHGGSDPQNQPLTKPPGWTAAAPGPLPAWVLTTTDYLKYLGLVLLP